MGGAERRRIEQQGIGAHHGIGHRLAIGGRDGGPRSRVRLRCAHSIYRSSDFLVGPNTSSGVIVLRPWYDDCIRYRIGMIWACEHNTFRFAQPAHVAAAEPRTGGSGPTRAAAPLHVAQASAGAAAGAGAAEMAGQWALKKIALPANVPREGLRPVVVAVLDSGLDYAHPYLKPENIWRNPSPGADPSYPDDLLGWNFLARDNRVWDDRSAT